MAIAIPVFADEAIETMPAPEYVFIRRYSSTQCRVGGASSLPFRIAGSSSSDTFDRTIMQYTSALEKNTFYHTTYEIDLSDSTTANKRFYKELGTGAITDQGGSVRTILMPANQIIGRIQVGMQSTIIDMDYSYLQSQAIENYVGAKAYYYYTWVDDNTFKIDTIMYFNDEFFQYGWNYDASHARYMQCYYGIQIPLIGTLNLKSVETYKVGGTDYNGKLDRIISLLQAQGGGLSREDIQAATLAALEQHDAAEEQKGNNKIQQIKQQIESITEPYKENLTTLQDSMRSITGALNYSGTSAVLTLPEARNPMTNNSLLWEQKQIDLAAYWDMLPAALRSAISIVLSFVILYKVIMEMVDEITWVIYMDKNVDKAERGGVTI